MSKPSRHNAILKIVEQASPANQDELRKALVRVGFKVTQATLSRDIRELGLVKSSDGYQFAPGAPAAIAGEQILPSADRLVREFVLDVREAQNLLVVKTAVGSAQPVAASLDVESWTEVLGTIAGDDTILMVTEDSRSAHRLGLRIRELLA
jgi:transcriptional regulator of arginine metabolism